jgi:hypothetical protein
MEEQVPVVETAEDVDAHVGKTALVRGTYVEIDVRKQQTEPPVYEGYAAVRLSDGALVLLGTPGPVRSQKERDELRDQAVVAEGFVNAICPSDGGASLQLPCLFPLLTVLTPELHELLKSL